MNIFFWSFATLSALVFAFPTKSPRPLVLWHGLGDAHSSPGMLQFISLVKDMHPGIFVHSVYIDEDLDKDRKAGFYGNVNDQVELAAKQLAAIPELEGGFDAIGFSQGGQFLRAYVERYNSPQVNNLLTFGSQHMGISDIPACRPYDLLCQLARRAMKSSAYGEWAQENIVQAQYYRDPNNLETYLTANHFLPSINNEVAESRNATYARNLASLNTLVLIMFTKDKTVVPKESAWFGSQTQDEFVSGEQMVLGGDEVIKTIVPMRLQPLYQEDWIGLRTLDERGGVIFSVCVGEHMEMGDCWQDLVKKYVGGV